MEYVILFFFFNDTATTEIYTLSLHDALPIFRLAHAGDVLEDRAVEQLHVLRQVADVAAEVLPRSEEHTSELQSRQYLVCRLLLEKKNNKQHQVHHKSKGTLILTYNLKFTRNY